ncbi:MAG TPA: hypothetical protein VIL55_02990, partial [Naasia sp.]
LRGAAVPGAFAAGVLLPPAAFAPERPAAEAAPFPDAPARGADVLPVARGFPPAAGTRGVDPSDGRGWRGAGVRRGTPERPAAASSAAGEPAP